MPLPALEINDVSKHYRLFANPRHKLFAALAGKAHAGTVVHALSGVGFNVNRGECLGVVGRNGSGKSTLLRIASGAVLPSSGSVTARGRIGAILELGAGLDPDLTGRGNIAMLGRLLGIGGDGAEGAAEGIMGFAELGEAIDRPVRTYSSGMAMRLAFSISMWSRPDILMIDEALAVGDASFQRRCSELIKAKRAEGQTLLFVSHSAGSVAEMCDRAVLLDQGRLICVGEPRMVLNRYQELLAGSSPTRARPAEAASPPSDLNADPLVDGLAARPYHNRGEHRFGNGRGRILDARLGDAAGELRGRLVEQGADCWLELAAWMPDAHPDLVVGFDIKTTTGTVVFGCNTREAGVRFPATGPHRVRLSFRADLGIGDYFLSIGLVSAPLGGDVEVHDRRYDSIHITVVSAQVRTSGLAILPHNVELLA